MMKRTLAVIAGSLLFLAAKPAPPARPAPPAPEAPEEDSAREVMIFRSGGPRLGVSLEDISADRAKELRLKEETGAEIKSVVPDSPAAEAGLEEGDVILEYQGTRVESAAQLARMVRETPAGRTVALEVSRNGAPRTVRVKLEEREDDHRKFVRRHRIEIPHIKVPQIDIPEIDIDIPSTPSLLDLGGIPLSLRLGVQVEGLTDQLGEYFGVKEGNGVLVRSVRKGSPGETAGLRAGDVIVRVDDEEVSDASDLRSALRDKRGKELKLTVVRDRREQTLTVAVPKEDESPRGVAAPRPRRQIDREVRDRARAEAQRERARARREAQRLQEEMLREEPFRTEDEEIEEETTPAPDDEDFEYSDKNRL
jgi:membrane-associated protease RseP (regulator of RpoE activity)